MLEQFLSTLEPTAHVWVKERKPAMSADAGRLADDYEQARRLSEHGHKQTRKATGPKQCYNCKKPGHLAQDYLTQTSTEDSTAAVEGKQLPKTENWEKRGDKGLKCFNYQEKGHISRRYPCNAALLCQSQSLPAECVGVS